MTERLYFYVYMLLAGVCVADPLYLMFLQCSVPLLPLIAQGTHHRDGAGGVIVGIQERITIPVAPVPGRFSLLIYMKMKGWLVGSFSWAR